MRFIPVLLICVALATSAGCFGKDDENGGDPPTTTTPTGTGTTPTTGGTTPTGTPTSPTTGGNTTTPPAAPPAKELCPVSKDFATQTPAPGSTPPVITAGTCGTVTTGYTKIALVGNFSANGGAPAVLAEGIAVKVLDAAGTAVLTCAGPGPGPLAAPAACTQEGTALVGDYTLQFEGTGTVTFTGSVVVS